MRSRPALPLRQAIAAAAILALPGAGCGRASLVLPVRLEPETLSAPVRPGPITGYESAVRAIAAIIVTELELPLPRQFTVFVYSTRAEYHQGLVHVAGISPMRAAKIADYSVGLGHHRQLFINDEAFRGAPRSDWLGVVAHELTHTAQYELSGGRRGRSEQWLREGMADWVRFLVLERLGEDTFRRQQDRALRAIAGALPALRDDPPDLLVLGSPPGWSARTVRWGDRLTYGLAFLLTDDLIRHRGFENLRAYFRAFANSDDRFGHFRRAFARSLAEFQSEALDRIRTDLERAKGQPGGESVFVADAGPEARVFETCLGPGPTTGPGAGTRAPWEGPCGLSAPLVVR